MYHSFQLSSSYLSVSRSSSSGTFLIISPCLISTPQPSPPAIPRSASYASPGPLTTHPITASFKSRSYPESIFSTFPARSIRLIHVLPHVGHETTSIPPFLKPRVLSISFAASISLTGSSVRETLIVSPIP